MNAHELRFQIDTECSDIQQTLDDLKQIQDIITTRELTVFERSGVALMLSSFYNGVENILKRLCKYHDIPLPKTETWHLDLFKRFCEPPMKPLPRIFTKEQEEKWGKYRKFRHVVHHGYAFKLLWEYMMQGVIESEDLYSAFKAIIEEHLETLDT
jgi:hypothetical protein